jgi:hypothetical protein
MWPAALRRVRLTRASLRATGQRVNRGNRLKVASDTCREAAPCYLRSMADVPYGHEDLSALERIDRAIARIEAAVRTRDAAGAALGKRHEILRSRMAEAVVALDAVLARPGEDD